MKVSGIDAGCLVLRGAALFLALTFGREKLEGLVGTLGRGQPLESWGFVGFLRGQGLPAPAFLAVCAALNESVLALAVAVGLATRVVAALIAAGMGVALVVSLRLEEEPVRALLYATAFATLATTGAGRFSLDRLLSLRMRRKAGA